MENKFVIRSQHNLYLAKNKEDWVTGEEPNQVIALKHHDEALNTLIEKNAKDILIRGTIIEVPLNEKGKPIVEVLVTTAEQEQQQQDLLAESTDAEEPSTEEQNSVESEEAGDSPLDSLEASGGEVVQEASELSEEVTEGDSEEAEPEEPETIS